MQHDMFKPDEDLEMHWKITKIRYGKKTWNAQNQMWEKNVAEIHTEPIGWTKPAPDDSVPWD